MELTSGAAPPAVEHAAPAKTPAAAHGQQHPIKLDLVVWTALFVLSACSYLVDDFNFQGYLRWS
ncbi:MAG: cytochrome C oxidase subunit IV, partial [Methylocystis sp.]